MVSKGNPKVAFDIIWKYILKELSFPDENWHIDRTGEMSESPLEEYYELETGWDYADPTKIGIYFLLYAVIEDTKCNL